MQVFIVGTPYETAEVLDINRFNKQMIENQQIMDAILGSGMKKKKPKYPKTFVECAKTLGCFCAAYIDGYKWELLENLQELLMCRDAYWNIAGDWKPNWEDGNTTKYTISCVKNKIELRKAHEYTFVLAFTTEEMRDAFYENFKDLIEECKELL